MFSDGVLNLESVISSLAAKSSGLTRSQIDNGMMVQTVGKISDLNMWDTRMSGEYWNRYVIIF